MAENQYLPEKHHHFNKTTNRNGFWSLRIQLENKDAGWKIKTETQLGWLKGPTKKFTMLWNPKQVQETPNLSGKQREYKYGSTEDSMTNGGVKLSNLFRNWVKWPDSIYVAAIITTGQLLKKMLPWLSASAEKEFMLSHNT